MEDILMYAMKLTLGLIGVMIVLRLMGKKELAQVTPLDFVYALILGGIIEESLYDATVPVYEMLFSIFFWALLIFILEKFALKSRRFKSIS
jgi:Predicted membrane protein